MFTGLVEGMGVVRAAERRGTGARIQIATPSKDWEAAEGQSIAVSGACLTVVGARAATGAGPVPFGTPGADLVFDLSSETLERTWLGELAPGRRVNLERALRLCDRLDGHMVAGHVDGRGRVTSIEDSGDGGWTMTFEVEPELERYLVDKGSATLDGVSLTVVRPRGAAFDVAVIPATLAKTTLGLARVGDPVNVEVDLVAKWIERLARR